MNSNADIRDDVYARTVKLVLESFGHISDLPSQMFPVVWVTTYRACEVAIELERQGPNALVKTALLQGGQAAYEMERAIRRFSLLKEMLPLIRSGTSNTERLRTTQLLVDILRWNIDAAGMSVPRRIFSRRFAKADPLYGSAVPSELL